MVGTTRRNGASMGSVRRPSRWKIGEPGCTHDRMTNPSTIKKSICRTTRANVLTANPMAPDNAMGAKSADEASDPESSVNNSVHSDAYSKARTTAATTLAQSILD